MFGRAVPYCHRVSIKCNEKERNGIKIKNGEYNINIKRKKSLHFIERGDIV